MLAEEFKIKNLRHKEHLEWLNQLEFYREQIGIFQEELLLTLHRHPQYWSIVEHVKEYRRIFMRKLERIEELKEEIILLEKELTERVHTEAAPFVDEASTGRKMKKFVKKFEELKKNFRKFVAKNS